MRNVPTSIDINVWFDLAGKRQLQGWGGKVWDKQSFLKDDWKGQRQGGPSAGQWGGTSDVEYMQVAKVWLLKLLRFETAWNLGEDSPWCAVFVAEDLAVFEFREDLKYFYK